MPKKGKNKFKGVTIKLRLIPPPCELLTRKEALAWLGEDAYRWIWIGGDGAARAEDRETREAFNQLLVDAGDMVAACAAVIDTDKPARLRNDASEYVRELARIVAARPAETRAPDVCFDVLAQQLVEQLDRETAA